MLKRRFAPLQNIFLKAFSRTRGVIRPFARSDDRANLSLSRLWDSRARDTTYALPTCQNLSR